MRDLLYLCAAEDHPEGHSLKVLFVIRKDTLAPGMEHPYFESQLWQCDIFGVLSDPWYRIENDLIYPTLVHPNGEDAKPHFRIEGRKVYTTEYHPCGVADEVWFWIR